MSSIDDDDDDDNEYIIHGQLLDPIQEDEIVKKTKSFDQFVKDENGRRRFHGAFTGGFSAGFYNTVGSLEGWTPSTFKSSRESKITLKTQNAYDFMDDEDKRDLGIDSSSLKIKSEYSNHSRKREVPEINNFVIPGKPVLGEILKPIKDSWGVELLKNLGWKPGQGVGPKLTQKQRLDSKNALENVGFNTNNIKNNDYEVNELLENIKFSPFEYKSIVILPKFDIFGLGYQRLKTFDDSVKPSKKYSKLTFEGKSIHGQAFGVGAFEDQDDDIYATENMSNYDFTLDKPKELKNKLNSNKYNTECIDGFVENTCKKNLFDVCPILTKIPPEWSPQGMFDRIVGHFPDISNQSQCSIVKQTEIKPFDNQIICTSVEKFIKKEEPCLHSDIISDRFTKAVLQDDSTNALIPVVRTIDTSLQRLKDFADKKMYGFWTRRTEQWFPDKLLCKRFNIPVSKQTIIKSEQDEINNKKRNLFNSLDFNSTFENPTINSLPLAMDKFNQEKVDNQFNLKENTKDTSIVTELEKPSVDFFKDIFLSDNDDDDNDDDNDNDIVIDQDSLKTNNLSMNSNKNISLINLESVTEESIESNTKTTNIFPSKGIFANLNFDNLFAPNQKHEIYKQQNDNINKSYGPVLPEHGNLIKNALNINPIDNTFIEDEWTEKVELSNVSSHKKKSKKHKHKSKKKSHKYK